MLSWVHNGTSLVGVVVVINAGAMHCSRVAVLLFLGCFFASRLRRAGSNFDSSCKVKFKSSPEAQDPITLCEALVVTVEAP